MEVAAVSEVVTVSPEFQVVIPLSIRKSLGIKAGQKVELRQCDGRIELVPQKPMDEYFGLLRGLENDFEREPDRELRVLSIRQAGSSF